MSHLVLVQVDKTLCSDADHYRPADIDVKTTIIARLYDPAYSHGARKDEDGSAVSKDPLLEGGGGLRTTRQRTGPHRTSVLRQIRIPDRIPNGRTV